MIEKVSIIIPAYNVEREIEESIVSILEQTYYNLEIIIINDGSIDNTFSIIKRYAASDSRIKVINQNNSGQSVARNKGLNEATGKYIYFFDADDFLQKEAIFELVNKMQQFDADMITFDANVLKNKRIIPYIHHKKMRENTVYSRTSFLKHTRWNNTPVWIYFYKKDFLINNNISFLQNIIYEDNLFYIDIVANASSIVYINRPFFLYKKRINSTMGNLHNVNFKIKSFCIVKNEIDIRQNNQKNEDIFDDFLNYRKNVVNANIIKFKGNGSIIKSFIFMLKNNLTNKFMLFYFVKLFLKRLVSLFKRVAS